MEEKIIHCIVKDEWVDYNVHLNDVEYARIFSLVVEELMIKVGIDEAFRVEQAYSIFTLETHLCYLAEANLDDQLTVHLQLLDHDTKRMHVFFIMKNENDDIVATSEQKIGRASCRERG